MKRIILGISVCLICSLGVTAQQAETRAAGEASNQASARASDDGRAINLGSGTSLSGQLQNSIDVRRAKVGDEVVLKTARAIKSDGRVVVNKGARLVGHVTEVAQRTKGNGESRIGILFDRLEQGSLKTSIEATITSVTAATINQRADNDDLFGNEASAGGSARSSSSTRSSSSANNGGLLGGVGSTVSSATSTVGNVVGGTASAVGTTVDSTTNAAGNTTAGVGRSLAGIQISQSSNTSVEGSSVLSLHGGDLKLEKGTNFNLVLTESTSSTSKTP